MRAMLISILLLACPSAFGAATAATLEKYCETKWSKEGKVDLGMYKHCLESQVQNVVQIAGLQKELGGQYWFEKISGPTCFETWTKNELSDYEMIAYCMRSEKAAQANLLKAFASKKFDRDIVDMCIGNTFSSSTSNAHMETALYCLNHSLGEGVALFGKELTGALKDHPTLREDIESAFFGKPISVLKLDGNKMPDLPDVSKLQLPKSGAQEASTQPTLWEATKQFFTVNDRTALRPKDTSPPKTAISMSKSGCAIDKTKLDFLYACSAAASYNDMSGSRPHRSEQQNRDMCRCVANNFTVEEMVDRTDCNDFPFGKIYAIFRNDRVILKCATD